MESTYRADMVKYLPLILLLACTSPVEVVEIPTVDTLYVTEIDTSLVYADLSNGFTIFWDWADLKQPSDSIKVLWRYRIVRRDSAITDSVFAVGVLYDFEHTKELDVSQNFVPAPDGKAWYYLDNVTSTHWSGWFGEWPIDPGMGIELR